MKINLKSTYNLLIIKENSLVFAEGVKIKSVFKITKIKEVKVQIYNENTFNFSNLEKAILDFIKEEKLKSFGVIIDIPVFIFQKISINVSAVNPEGIANYLKINFPLPLERYIYVYKEESREKNYQISNVNIVFVAKEVISKIIEILQKHELIPLFISNSAESLYFYLIREAIISFNENYLIFIIRENNILVLVLENLRITKIFWEEIKDYKEIKNIIQRFFNFIKTNLKADSKIYFFSEGDEFKIDDIKNIQRSFKYNIEEQIIKGSFYLFDLVFKGNEIIDFLPIKTFNAYFLSKLPQVFIFLTVLILSLVITITGPFLFLNFKLIKEKNELSTKLNSLNYVSTNLQNVIEELIKIKEKINFSNKEKLEKIIEILSINNVQNISFKQNEIQFTLKINKNDIDKVKGQVIQKYPQAQIIKEEIISESEALLTFKI